MDNSDFDLNYEDLAENQDNQTKSKKKQITISDRQKQKIEETIRKMGDNLVQPQHSCGKVFQGAGFASNPDKIIYKDFEVGVAMSITIELINISYSFNSFKLMALDDEIIDFFEIDYKPCGRVPAGIGTTMTLKFTPMVDKDYFSHLKLLSETGLVMIPIHCLARKCEVNIINNLLDFGDVILGQEIHKHLNLENTGALSCKFTFVDEKSNLLSVNLERPLNTETDFGEENKISDEKNYSEYVERMIIVNKSNLENDLQNDTDTSMIHQKYILKQIKFPNKGVIDSYCKKSISFILNSKFIGKYEQKLQMRIEYKKITEYRTIVIKFNTIDLPLFPDKKIYNLDYLVNDNTFREKVTIFNTSNISYKIQMYHHKDLTEFIEINPNLGYVQSNSSFEIWVKLKITENIYNLDKFFYNDSNFNFPIKISITNIKIPIIINFKFSLTNDSILFEKRFLNFGKCLINETNQLNIEMLNESLHPMKYGYIMMPKEFAVKKNIDTILSKEKTNCDIIFDAKDTYIGHREGDIFCRVATHDLTVQNIKLKYHIELINPDIEIKPKNMNFPVLPDGEKMSLRIVIKNNLKENYLCEWLTPPFCISGLKIMPKVFELPGEGFITCVVQYESEYRPYGPFSHENVEKEIGMKLDSIDSSDNTDKFNEENPYLETKIKNELTNALYSNYDPKDDKKKKNVQNAQNTKNVIPKKQEAKKDKKQLEEDERKRKEEEDRLIQIEEEKNMKRIQEFNKEKELKLFGAEIISFDDENGKSEHSKFIIPMYYKSVTNNNLKSTYIEISTCCTEKYLVFDKPIVDFGDVSVQNSKTMNVLLINKRNKPAIVQMKSLIVSNCFQTINSVRTIQPNSNFNFIIEFFPMKDITYYEDFCVYTEDSQSTIRLKGRGVQPEIDISNVSESNVFNLGNVCVNNTLEKSIEIINKSFFDVSFEVKTLNFGKKNRSGYKPFSFIPHKGQFKANSKTSIKLIFYGDHQEFENFFELIQVDVPNQKTPRNIYVTASCWNRQAYWRSYKILDFPDEEFLKRPIDQDYFSETLKIKSVSPSSNNDKIYLEFLKHSNSNDEIEKLTKQKILIGNCKLNDAKLEKNLSYEIIIPKDDIYFTCDNSKGTVNSGSETIVTFNFKKPTKDPLFKDIDCLAGIGMWVTSRAEMRISGGYVPMGIVDSTVVEIFLKAYIENI